MKREPELESFIKDTIVNLEPVYHHHEYKVPIGAGPFDVVAYQNEVERSFYLQFHRTFAGKVIEIEKKKMISFNVLDYLYEMGFPKWLTFLLPKRFRQNQEVNKYVNIQARYALTDPLINWARQKQVYLVELDPPQVIDSPDR